MAGNWRKGFQTARAGFRVPLPSPSPSAVCHNRHCRPKAHLQCLEVPARQAQYDAVPDPVSDVVPAEVHSGALLKDPPFQFRVQRLEKG